MMRGVIWLLTLLIFCALHSWGDEQWLRIKSPNFEIYTTAGQRDGRDLIRRFEQVRGFYMKALSLSLSDSRPVCIIAFRSDKEYEPYSPKDFAAAFYLPGFRREFIVMKGAGSEYYIPAVHEYTHLLVKQSGITVPLWLNEGLAQFYSTMEERGGRIVVGKPIPNVGDTLANEKWIDLRAIFAAGPDSALYNDKKQAGMFYAESWALTHMLWQGANYRAKTPEMLNLLAAGSEPQAAFQQAYGKSLDKVQSELRQYIGSNGLSATVFDFKWDKAADTPETSADAPAARLALAEMLSQTEGQRAKALVAYEQLARDYPKRWEVEAGWGSALLYGRDTAQAAQHLAKAVELGCDDPKAFLDYQRALLRQGREKDAIAALRSGIRATQDNGDLHRELAIALTQAGEYNDALLEFEQVKRISDADAVQFYYNAGYAYYRIEDFKRSAKALETAAKYASDPSMKKAIGDLRSIIESAENRPAATPPFQAAGPETGSVEGPPRIARPRVVNVDTAEHAEELIPPKLPTIEGVLLEVQCLGQAARLRITVDGATQTYAILNPNNVTIHSGDGKPVEFTCGPGQSHRIRIEYEASSDGQVAGNVRGIEFF
jgi:tetratricopeptide (TPR) repeat protein